MPSAQAGLTRMTVIQQNAYLCRRKLRASCFFSKNEQESTTFLSQDQKKNDYVEKKMVWNEAQ